VLADAIGLRRENVPQNNSFSAFIAPKSDGGGSDGEKVTRRPDEVNREPRERRERSLTRIPPAATGASTAGGFSPIESESVLIRAIRV
jgi:hypothetical protein